MDSTVRGPTPSMGKRFVSSPAGPDKLWYPRSHLFSGYRGGNSLPGQSDRSVSPVILLRIRDQVKNEWVYTSTSLIYLCDPYRQFLSFCTTYVDIALTTSWQDPKFSQVLLSTCLLSFSYHISAIPKSSLLFPLRDEHPHPHSRGIIPISGFATSVRGITRIPLV